MNNLTVGDRVSYFDNKKEAFITGNIVSVFNNGSVLVYLSEYNSDGIKILTIDLEDSALTLNKISLDNLKEATEQEVFNQASIYLLSMKSPSYSDQLAQCAYRDGEGNKCVGGNFILDSQYDEYFEEVGSWEELVKEGIAPQKHAALIQKFQHVHDNLVNLPVNLRTEGIYKIAVEYHFVTEAVNFFMDLSKV